MLTLLAALAAAPLQAPACPIDRAVYRLHGAPQFTAGFAPQDKRRGTGSDLAFWLKTPKRTYWFSLGSPNGYGGTYITPDADPIRSAAAPEPARTPKPPEGQEFISIDFDAFGADLAAYDAPPQLENPAPALLFARELGPHLWYEPVALAGGDEKAEPESMPIGFFEPAGCRKP